LGKKILLVRGRYFLIDWLRATTERIQYIYRLFAATYFTLKVAKLIKEATILNYKREDGETKKKKTEVSVVMEREGRIA